MKPHNNDGIAIRKWLFYRLFGNRGCYSILLKVYIILHNFACQFISMFSGEKYLSTHVQHSYAIPYKLTTNHLRTHILNKWSPWQTA